MEIISTIMILGLLFIAAVVPKVLIVIDIICLVKKKEKPLFEFFAFLTGAVFTLFALIVWDLPEYDKPLNLYGGSNMHTPFSEKYMFVFWIVAILGFCAYFLLKFQKIFPPLVKALLLSLIYISCVYNILWIVQLAFGANPRTSADYPNYHLSFSAYDIYILTQLCVVPAFYLLHCGLLIWNIIKDTANEQEQKQYENPVLNKINTFLLKGTNLLLAGFIFVLPVLCIVLVILCFFGQQPEALLYTFTKTSDWILSKEISPPPVAFDTHYLCTVSLRGHKKLVKPLRYGIRKGEKIVVNRQLCVANAFEELIMERTPGFHRALRHFYDTYGYPISKHINNAWSADLVYIIMKPAEWLFVAVLYMADIKPEDRICRQYIPADELKKYYKT